MDINYDKKYKLVAVAKMYYEQSLKQEEIASRLQISRPLVSRYLNEAKACGIVHIEIRSPVEGNSLLIGHLRKAFRIRGGMAVQDEKNDQMTNRMIARAFVSSLGCEKVTHFAIGWGRVIGEILFLLEKQPDPSVPLIQSICPLIGNSSIFNRCYHSNEIIRVIAKKTGANPCYWNVPAFVESKYQAEQVRMLKSYKYITAEWEKAMFAIVNIGNFLSTPDFITSASFKNKLMEEKAVGRLLCYYFNQDGKIIHDENDKTMQIPFETLIRIPNIVAVCAADILPITLLGALRTGLFSYIIASESLVNKVLKLMEVEIS